MSSAYLKAMHGQKAGHKTVFDADPSDSRLKVTYNSGGGGGGGRDAHRMVASALVGNRHAPAASKYQLDAELGNADVRRGRRSESGSSSSSAAAGGARNSGGVNAIELPDKPASASSGRRRRGEGGGRAARRATAESAKRVDAYRELRADSEFEELVRRYRDSGRAADALEAATYAAKKGVPDEASKHFEAALALDAEHLPTLGAYGAFAETIERDFDKAERLLQWRHLSGLSCRGAQAAALSGRPKYIRLYATFLREVRGDEKLAAKVLRAAAEATADAEPDADAGAGRRRRRHHRSRD